MDETILWSKEMRDKSVLVLAIPSIIFLVLGALVFFIFSETRAFVEGSVILVTLCVAGLSLVGILAFFIAHRISS